MSKSTSIRIQVYPVKASLASDTQITLWARISSRSLSSPGTRVVSLTAEWVEQEEGETLRGELGHAGPYLRERLGLRLKSPAAFGERHKARFAQYFASDAAVHALRFLFPRPPPPCFAVSAFLSDLRKIKFILLIKIMTLSLVLFSSVSTYSLCWVYLKPMGLVTRMRMKRDRTIPQAQQSQLYKPSGLARERPYRRDGIVGTCVI